MDESDPIEALSLPARALGALHRLRIRTVKQFLSLTMADVLRLPGYGRGTQAILAKRLGNLARSLPRAGQEGSSDADPLSFNLLVDSLSTRARHAIEMLGISDIVALLKIKESDVLPLRYVGQATWNEIAAILPAARAAGAGRPVRADDPLNEVFEHSPPSPGVIWALPFFCDGSRQSAKPKSFHEAYGADLPLHRIKLTWSLRKAARKIRIETLGDLLTTRPETLRHMGVGYSGLDRTREQLADIILSGQASSLVRQLFSPETAPGATGGPLPTSLLGRQPFTPESLLSMPLYTNYPSPRLNPASLHPSFCPTLAILELDLSVRASRALKRLKVITIGDLLGVLPDDLYGVANCATISVSEIQEKLRVFLLKHHGLLPSPQVDLGSFNKMVWSLMKAVVRDHRARRVLAKRLGLDNGHIPTLEKLASAFDVTRERIRQLEVLARRSLSAPSGLRFLAPFRDAIAQLLPEAGRTVAVNDLAVQVARHFGWRRMPSASGLIGILEAIPEVNILKDRKLGCVASLQMHRL